MRPIVQVRNLGKRYHMRWSLNAHPTLREALVGAVKAPFERMGGRNGSENALWALRNVSFEVNPGEVIGIIGPNGAGKSTLLKILSRITKPTEGEADIYGRVGSLLEIGTGFHPDLNGRDNIFLNGTTLGMRVQEIKRKFDEIVEFSGVGRFLETPVKHYSTGMYLRLAFSIAAHFEPEVLLLDEVIAVGDLAFQKKCVEKMRDVSRKGRTVFLVSHNLQTVQELCQRVFLIQSGRLCEEENVTATIARYVSDKEPGENGLQQA